MDGESELVLPLVAEAAGLSKIGRHGHLVHPPYGSRIRLGAVTTDLPLKEEFPKSFYLLEYCETCGRCALQRPSQAIPSSFRNQEKEGFWKVDHNKCYSAWKELGTDCGVCLADYPFSKYKKAKAVKPEGLAF